MKRAALALTLTGLAPAALAAPAYDAGAFQTDLARFGQGDAGLDAHGLRLANRARLGGTVPEWAEAKAAWGLVEQEPARALAMAQAQLSIDPLNLNALYLAEEALPRLGRGEESRLRHAQILILLRSITGGKDGTARERAWNVVSAAEKDTALALLGFAVSSETAIREGGRTFALVNATPPLGGGPTTLWIALDNLGA